MAGTFEIKKSKDNQFYFVLKAAGNHAVNLTSEMYPAKANAQKGIAAVQENAPAAKVVDLT
jgi:uncharacterized protein